MEAAYEKIEEKDKIPEEKEKALQKKDRALADALIELAELRKLKETL